jgi:hypothetical protein
MSTPVASPKTIRTSRITLEQNVPAYETTVSDAGESQRLLRWLTETQARYFPERATARRTAS